MLSSASDDEVGGSSSAIRAERSGAIKLCSHFKPPATSRQASIG